MKSVFISSNFSIKILDPSRIKIDCEFPYSKIALIIQSAASLSDTTNSKPFSSVYLNLIRLQSGSLHIFLAVFSIVSAQSKTT
ncbi:MAG TPA: hypothetical protein VFK40_14805 [Nitrososphaeraceae archaeon]|nr:hypothetical protein [Nitrososphaeraceae archaeon]